MATSQPIDNIDNTGNSKVFKNGVMIGKTVESTLGVTTSISTSLEQSVSVSLAKTTESKTTIYDKSKSLVDIANNTFRELCKTLENEQAKLYELEERRKKLQEEMQRLKAEIEEEKYLYKMNIIDSFSNNLITTNEELPSLTELEENDVNKKTQLNDIITSELRCKIFDNPKIEENWESNGEGKSENNDGKVEKLEDKILSFEDKVHNVQSNFKNVIAACIIDQCINIENVENTELKN